MYEEIKNSGQENVDEIHDQDIEIIKLKAKLEIMELKQFAFTEQIGWLRSIIEKSITGEVQDVVTMKADMEGMKHLLSDILHNKVNGNDD